MKHNQMLVLSFLTLLLCACSTRQALNTRRIEKMSPDLTYAYQFHLNGPVPIETYVSTAKEEALIPVGTEILGWMRTEDSVFVLAYVLKGGDYPIPAIKTFKNGTFISQKQIGEGSCGSGECGYYCDEYLEAGDGRWFVAIIHQRQYQCDAQGKPLLETVQSDTTIRRYKVDRLGQIAEK